MSSLCVQFDQRIVIRMGERQSASAVHELPRPSSTAAPTPASTTSRMPSRRPARGPRPAPPSPSAARWAAGARPGPRRRARRQAAASGVAAGAGRAAPRRGSRPRCRPRPTTTRQHVSAPAACSPPRRTHDSPSATDRGVPAAAGSASSWPRTRPGRGPGAARTRGPPGTRPAPPPPRPRGAPPRARSSTAPASGLRPSGTRAPAAPAGPAPPLRPRPVPAARPPPRAGRRRRRRGPGRRRLPCARSTVQPAGSPSSASPTASARSPDRTTTSPCPGLGRGPLHRRGERRAAVVPRAGEQAGPGRLRPQQLRRLRAGVRPGEAGEHLLQRVARQRGGRPRRSRTGPPSACSRARTWRPHSRTVAGGGPGDRTVARRRAPRPCRVPRGRRPSVRTSSGSTCRTSRARATSAAAPGGTGAPRTAAMHPGQRAARRERAVAEQPQRLPHPVGAQPGEHRGGHRTVPRRRQQRRAASSVPARSAPGRRRRPRSPRRAAARSDACQPGSRSSRVRHVPRAAPATRDGTAVGQHGRGGRGVDLHLAQHRGARPAAVGLRGGEVRHGRRRPGAGQAGAGVRGRRPCAPPPRRSPPPARRRSCARRCRTSRQQLLRGARTRAAGARQRAGRGPGEVPDAAHLRVGGRRVAPAHPTPPRAGAQPPAQLAEEGGGRVQPGRQVRERGRLPGGGSSGTGSGSGQPIGPVTGPAPRPARQQQGGVELQPTRRRCRRRWHRASGAPRPARWPACGGGPGTARPAPAAGRRRPPSSTRRVRARRRSPAASASDRPSARTLSTGISMLTGAVCGRAADPRGRRPQADRRPGPPPDRVSTASTGAVHRSWTARRAPTLPACRTRGTTASVAPRCRSCWSAGWSPPSWSSAPSPPPTPSWSSRRCRPCATARRSRPPTGPTRRPSTPAGRDASCRCPGRRRRRRSPTSSAAAGRRWTRGRPRPTARR